MKMLQTGRSFWQESGGKTIDLAAFLAGLDRRDGIFWLSGVDHHVGTETTVTVTHFGRLVVQVCVLIAMRPQSRPLCYPPADPANQATTWAI